ncbi:isotocin receptor-like isoform X1 [Diachasmimorpha longicaudata]|uniref:isotocin receptor-like isoform X1 n=2 Tax=Diachasmimorpha longicaudata TaxID=58733 RepID=UPI0030B8C9B9
MIEDPRDEYLAVWEIVVLVVIFVITVIGNFLVLFALYLRRYCGRRRKLTRMYFFIMHLSIADLMTGVLNVLPQLVWDITGGRFQGGAILCKIVKFGQPLGHYASTYILIAGAIDRYHAICYPFHYCRTTHRQAKVMVYVAWSISMALCIPQIFIFSYQQISPGIWDCWADFVPRYGQKAYVTWYSITVLLLPVSVLVYTYVSICVEIWKNTEITVFGQRGEVKRMDSRENNREPVISRARIKTVKQMITVVSLHVMTSAPFVGCQLWAAWDPDAAKTSFYQGSAFTILTLLSSLTSCVNPWIYMGFNRELRSTLKNYIKRLVLGQSMTFDSDFSHHSTNSSTRSTIIGTMMRFASSMYRGKTSRASDPEPLRDLQESL